MTDALPQSSRDRVEEALDIRHASRVPTPARMARLPRDHRGFVVPFFVAWLKDGREVARETAGSEPEFRMVSSLAWRMCPANNLCWLCGQPLGVRKVFVLGPMCAVNRTNAEPPSHRDCATYAVRACPFLSRPRMRRNITEIDAPQKPAPGHMILRNPGLSVLWMTRTYQIIRAPVGQEGNLYRIGEPEWVEWWREGRHASRAEAEQAIADGLVGLREIALSHNEDPDEIKPFVERLRPWLPAA